MSRTKIGAAALLAVVPLTALAATGGAAHAIEASGGPKSQVTVHVSDKTPASGEAFTVSGRFTTGGKAAGEQLVKVQAKQANGKWKALPGAREMSSSKGAYDIEVILNATGHRDLRVVGVALDTLPNGYKQFAVNVH